ncbi:angiopoietin-related protein 6-like [Musca autumnalis]|uniref:angiopoietin-related protein 6-like n=1 Tax=Musca autumnalis TaxID=221902 RepID=UPI003CF3FC06
MIFFSIQSRKTPHVIPQRAVNNNLGQTWTYILRRSDGSIHFNRNWQEYEMGFGDPAGDFFVGLKRLHALTSQGPPQELLIILESFKRHKRYAYYDRFRIGNASEKYAIVELGSYQGDAGDAMRFHYGKAFSTFDRNNMEPKVRNCAQTFEGGWWYHGIECYRGNLNGVYRQEKKWKHSGISWSPWLGSNRSLKYAAMMIRPRIM